MTLAIGLIIENLESGDFILILFYELAKSFYGFLSFILILGNFNKPRL
jgi:hypothetical protein